MSSAVESDTGGGGDGPGNGNESPGKRKKFLSELQLQEITKKIQQFNKSMAPNDEWKFTESKNTKPFKAEEPLTQDHYYLRDIWLWDPAKIFNIMIPCPRDCPGRFSFSDGTWACYKGNDRGSMFEFAREKDGSVKGIREVIGERDTKWLVYREYTCKICRAKFNTLNSEMLRKSPESVRMEFGMIVQPKTIVETKVAVMLYNGYMKTSTKGVVDQFNEMHAGFYAGLAAAYYSNAGRTAKTGNVFNTRGGRMDTYLKGFALTSGDIHFKIDGVQRVENASLDDIAQSKRRRKGNNKLRKSSILVLPK